MVKRGPQIEQTLLGGLVQAQLHHEAVVSPMGPNALRDEPHGLLLTNQRTDLAHVMRTCPGCMIRHSLLVRSVNPVDLGDNDH
eukprot:11211037-Lingulodinium_polyedra.AAC.1